MKNMFQDRVKKKKKNEFLQKQHNTSFMNTLSA